MKFIVDGKLAYEADFRVKVGDRVMLPDTGFVGGRWIGTVTALGDGGYTGSLRKALEWIGPLPRTKARKRPTKKVPQEPFWTKEKIANRIRREQRHGLSLRKIADGLNQDQVPTLRGGKEWYAGTIKSVLQTGEEPA